MNYEIQHMLKADGGAIVNNTSIAEMIAEAGISSYVAAKHAVIGLSRAAAIEYASQGIRINALAPELVETGMTKHQFADDKICASLVGNTPIGRAAQPEEIAEMCCFFARI
jgi:NAD(P)-dependent dehydrogenase (short-subunit alcohol dehydrogenase family)